MSLKLITDAQLYGFKYNHNKQHITLIVVFSGIKFEVNRETAAFKGASLALRECRFWRQLSTFFFLLRYQPR